MPGNIFHPRRAYSASNPGARRLTTGGAFTRSSARSSRTKGVVAVMIVVPVVANVVIPVGPVVVSVLIPLGPVALNVPANQGIDQFEKRAVQTRHPQAELSLHHDEGHELVDRQDQVRLEVADNGPGIPLEYSERIFDRFYRVDESRSADVGGAGLGLSIAQWAVRVHGGDLRLLPVKGRGCTFQICLPSVPG